MVVNVLVLHVVDSRRSSIPAYMEVMHFFEMFFAKSDFLCGIVIVDMAVPFVVWVKAERNWCLDVRLVPTNRHLYQQ